MKAMNVFRRAEEAAEAIRSVVAQPPRIAVVLGSGLGEFADRLIGAVVIPYAEIPHFPAATVAGHRGQLVIGPDVAVLQGRFHHYEGHDLDDVTFPVRVLQRLGVRELILTAAVGGIRDDLGPGRIVCVADHINLLGRNPLRGVHDDRLGTRFPDLTDLYTPRLRDLARDEADRLGIDLASGVYACMCGPSYETPAEIAMLRVLGADVVGMSTVAEAIVARQAGMGMLALAVVSNAAAGRSGEPITHAEVLEAGRAVGGRLADLIGRVVERIARGSPWS